MSEPRVFTCGDLAALLPHGAYGKGREGFLYHEPDKQRFHDAGHCFCTSGADSRYWQENAHLTERCRRMVLLTDARFPGLLLRLCCECRDRWPGSTAALFDAVAEFENLAPAVVVGSTQSSQLATFS